MDRKKGIRIQVANPRGKNGEAEVIVRGREKYFLIIPIEAGLFEIHYGGKYLGESTSLSGANTFIQRGGANAPVLIKNPDGGYEMYHYKSPAKKNPQKKYMAAKQRGKKKAKRNPAKNPRKKKKAAKKKVAKKKAKRKVAKKNPRKKKAAKRRPAKKRAKKKAAKRKPAKRKAAKRKPAKRKVAKKKAAKKTASKSKVSVDAAVKGYMKAKTGKSPW